MVGGISPPTIQLSFLNEGLKGAFHAFCSHFFLGNVEMFKKEGDYLKKKAKQEM